jgi:hypothetical protein
MARRLIARSLCAALASAGCAQPGAAPRTLQAMVEAARADAAQRVPGAAIEVASAESVTWRDGSLGCPQPGMLYTQALVPGWRIRLRAGGEWLDYHAATSGALVLCPPDRAVDPLPDAARY